MLSITCFSLTGHSRIMHGLFMISLHGLQNRFFYVNIPSRTDHAIAPPGNEALTFLIPIAPGIDDSELIREEYFEKIIARFEQVTGENIRDHIVVSQSYGIHDFVHDYHSYKGNAYGLANTLFQTGYFRPSIRNKKIRNLFYTGQLTVPGGGVPPAIMSGKIVATTISKKINPHAYAN